MGDLATARRELAAAVATAIGATGYPSPPPSLVPPCAVVMPGAGYVVGPLTGCAYAMAVTLRLVTDVHESAGGYDALDELLEAALGAVGRYQAVAVAAVDYGGSKYLVADATVTYSVDLGSLARV